MITFLELFDHGFVFRIEKKREIKKLACKFYWNLHVPAMNGTFGDVVIG